MSDAPSERAKRAVPSAKIKRIIKLERYDIIQAFNEVREAKLKTRIVGFKEIGEKWGVKPGTLRQYWSKYSRGLLDPGMPLTAKDAELTARGAHEKQLGLLRRAQAILLGGTEDTLTQIERTHAKGSKVMKLMKKHEMMELLRALKYTNEMIAMTERGYLALLDEYAEKMREREKQAVGTEVHAAVEMMTDEAKAIRALHAMNGEEAGVEASHEIVEAPAPPEPTPEVSETPPENLPQWNRPTT